MKLLVSGAPTLDRYTNDILKRGFHQQGIALVDELSEATHAILQLHGSPSSVRFDEEQVKQLSKYNSLKSCILLIHRPDEIQIRVPSLKAALLDAPPTFGVAMLGTSYIDDPFFAEQGSVQRQIRAIPHGFFEREKSHTHEHSQVVVGTHTTWGEMRSLKTAVELLAEVIKARDELPIIGYLGGVPLDALSHEVVRSLLITSGYTAPVVGYSAHGVHEPGSVIVNPGQPPRGFDVTFNLQIYHFGELVRKCESSGSLHASGGIPVIAEMNGAEHLEQLRVIKVPYDVTSSLISSLQLKSAAQHIISCVRSGEYREMLADNAVVAARWTPFSVARLYLDFFSELDVAIR